MTLVYENDRVIMMNSAVYAMNVLNAGMKGKAEKMHLNDEDSINKLVRDVLKQSRNDI